MNDNSPFNEQARAALRADPDLILNDPDLMAVLAEATAPGAGQTDVVDFRGMAMQRLEARMTRLEEMQAQILAASWQRINATDQTHRAILTALEVTNLAELAERLHGAVAETLGLAGIKLISEEGVLPEAEAVLTLKPGGVAGYMEDTRREIIQRRVACWPSAFAVDCAPDIRSEAVIDLGALTSLPGPVILVLGSTEAETYGPELGSDLLRVFGAVVARAVALLVAR